MARRGLGSTVAADLCVGCLFSVSTVSSGFIVTACCHRTICNPCVTRLRSCPVCRIQIIRGSNDMQRPIPEIPASFPSQGDDLPSYDTDSENHTERTGHVAPIDIHDGEPVPSYEFHKSTAVSMDIAELKTTEDGICAIHYVSSRDTLVGIGLKYNVPIDEIKRANKMFSSNINEREKLIIPGVKQLPKSVSDPSEEMKEERERTRRTKRFQLSTKCAAEEEARFYLEECEYDVDAAVARYLADVEWEAAHRPPNAFGNSSISSKRTRTRSTPTNFPSASSPSPFRSGSLSFSKNSFPMVEIPVQGKPKRLFGIF